VIELFLTEIIEALHVNGDTFGKYCGRFSCRNAAELTEMATDTRVTVGAGTGF